jgi:PAS domain S-box-containing protein
MNKGKPTYQELEKRLALAEPIVEALKHHEVDAVVGREKIAFLLLREVEQALRQSDAGFRAMFDLSGVGMFQADSPAFRFTRINQKFCEIVGFSPQELLAKTYISLTHPQDRRRDLSGLARVFRAKTNSWSIEKRCVRKDGSIIWVGVNGAALRDGNGRVINIMAMVSDITARKRAEQVLRNRSEQLRKLASELTLAERRESRRIARILHDHIRKLLGGAKHHKVPLKQIEEKTVRHVLKDVQKFIDQSIGLSRDRLDKGKPMRLKKRAAPKEFRESARSSKKPRPAP